jgi:hypothetical protein
MSRFRASLVSAALAAVWLGCGSKSGLRIPQRTVDASLDAFVPPGEDAGPDAPAPGDGGLPPPDLCIELPPHEPPRAVEVSFLSRILSAEVHFLVDVTGSMGEEIEQIRMRLRDAIIPGIAAQIPDVRFSVARYADYPVHPYGSSGAAGEPRDDLYRLEQASTTDIGAVQRAVERLTLQSGGDVPEATVEALYITATGEGPPSLVPARRCPPGTVGYPCFQPEGSRIVLLFTDAPMHNGPGGAEPYGPRLGFRAHHYEETVVELRRIGAKVLGLYSGVGAGVDEGLRHLQIVARDTGAVRPDGTPIVFDIGSDGRTLGADVVDAVRTLVEEVPIDVDTFVEDVPGDSFDARHFVTDIVAVRADPASGATMLRDRFVDVRPGTRVTFSIQLANERIERTSEVQVYRMTIVLRGDGVVRLDETVVDVVIPARDGRGCEVVTR